MSVSDFLLARIAEDERVAREATPGPWLDFGEIRTADGDAAVAMSSDERPPMQAEDSAHVARWDPARVLAECEAKRRIVERFAKPGGPMDDSDFADGWATGEEWTRDFLLQTLALPYADHPAYDESWRP